MEMRQEAMTPGQTCDNGGSRGEQRRRAESGGREKQRPRRAQQAEEEGTADNTPGRALLRTGREEAREVTEEKGRRESVGDDAAESETEPTTRQGQVATQTHGSQRIFHGPHLQSDLGGALSAKEADNGNQAGKTVELRGKGST